MYIIADLVSFLADLVSPRFVDSSLILCYTIRNNWKMTGRELKSCRLPYVMMKKHAMRR